jgi:hypothetical protein
MYAPVDAAITPTPQVTSPIMPYVAGRDTGPR